MGIRCLLCKGGYCETLVTVHDGLQPMRMVRGCAVCLGTVRLSIDFCC